MGMVSQMITITTRLEKTEELISYLEDYMTEYNRVYREVWYHMISEDYGETYAKPSYFVTEMCEKHQMLKRTINSIRYDVKGRIQALKALKETELQQLEIKISRKEENINQLKTFINQLKSLVRENRATKQQLSQYRKKKQSLYYQKNQLNQMKQAYQNLKYAIEHQIWKIGFGGKQMFEKQYHLTENGYGTKNQWYKEYRMVRDKNIFYLGSGDETAGNQMVQLRYQPNTNDFDIKIRKEKKYCSSTKEQDKYIVLHHIKFGYLQEQLVEVWNEGKQPISIRVQRKQKKWYLQCMFAIRYEEREYRTSCQDGTFGLDYNDGFIEMSETDACGNLMGQYHYELKHHGTGNRAENEIRQVISEIVDLAEKKGKNISIEALDFKKTKAKITKAKGKKGKKYHRMLHLFDYRRYQETLQNACHRQKVVLQKVNPKNTSKIGKEKYSVRKKLNPHQAASYVIARKGQGFCDRLKRK